MPNSLRCKIKTQMHKGLLTEKDGQRLIDALDRAENKCKNCTHWHSQTGTDRGRCDRLETYPRGEWCCADAEVRK